MYHILICELNYHSQWAYYSYGCICLILVYIVDDQHRWCNDKCARLKCGRSWKWAPIWSNQIFCNWYLLLLPNIASLRRMSKC